MIVPIADPMSLQFCPTVSKSGTKKKHAHAQMFTCRFDKYDIAPTDYLRSQCGTLETASIYSSSPWSSYEVCHVLVNRWQCLEWSRMVLNWTNLNQIRVESGICMLVQRVCKCVCLFPSNLLILLTHEDAWWKTNLGRPQDKHNQTPGKETDVSIWQL